MTDIASVSCGDIQQGVYDFLNGGSPNVMARTKAFACMECFQCTAGLCPEGLDPMGVNELVKGEYIARGLADRPAGDPRPAESAHQVLASVHVSPADYRRITTPAGGPGADTVFSPGCNVYFQPEKILNALDILDALGEAYGFLPGLDNCCGDGCFFSGDTPVGLKRAKSLVEAVAGLRAQTLVLWCPTCHCRFTRTILPSMAVPFEIRSFPQHLAANMDRLFLDESAAGTVTLHEAGYAKSPATSIWWPRPWASGGRTSSGSTPFGGIWI